MSKEKKVFLIRFFLFVIFGCVLPFVFIAWRYQIFKYDKMSITGWGFIAIVIVFFFILYLLNMLKKGMPYSMFTQCISGFSKVILPLLLLFFIVNGIKDNIDAFIQALLVTILCECVAIPINPLPKYVHDHQIKEKEDSMDTFLEKFKATWNEANGKKG